MIQPLLMVRLHRPAGGCDELARRKPEHDENSSCGEQESGGEELSLAKAGAWHHP
jgi:hypothetical protein